MSSVGGFRFEGLPADLQKEVLTFFKNDELAHDSRVSKLFMKLLDDPQLWTIMGKTYDITVDPKNARTDFLYKYAILTNPNSQDINDTLIELLPFTLEASKSLSEMDDVLDQRLAIEASIANHDYTAQFHENKAERTPADAIRVKTLKLLDSTYTAIMRMFTPSPKQQIALGAISVLLKNGVNTPDLGTGREKIFAISLKSFEVFKAYLEGQEKNKWAGISLQDHLSYAISNYASIDEKCTAALLKAGAVPNHKQVAEALLAIGYERGIDPSAVSAEKALGPLLNNYQSPGDQKVLKEARRMTIELLEASDKQHPRFETRFYTPANFSEKYQIELQEIQSQVQKFLDANLSK